MLNRERRRKFVKEAKAKGIPKEYIDAYITMLGSKNDRDLIEDGMKVMVNTERVKNGKNYESMSDKYKEFISQCNGEVFTAHIEDNGLVSLKESPDWLFWEGDLIKCRGEEDGRS